MFDVSAVGLVAGACTTIAFVPQVIHTLKTRDTHAISLGMYVLYVFGIVMWLSYGLLLDDLPLILANVVTLSLSASILVLKLRHTYGGKIPPCQ